MKGFNIKLERLLKVQNHISKIYLFQCANTFNYHNFFHPIR